MMRVHFIRSSASLTCRCVTLSSALVASSKNSTLGLGATARAMRMRWRWPPEIPPAPSDTIVFMPMGMARMSSAIPASSAASHASSIVSHGAATTMLEKMSPVNSFPSCSTVPMLRRKLATSSVSMSRPSYSTAPFCGFRIPAEAS